MAIIVRAVATGFTEAPAVAYRARGRAPPTSRVKATAIAPVHPLPAAIRAFPDGAEIASPPYPPQGAPRLSTVCSAGVRGTEGPSASVGADSR